MKPTIESQQGRYRGRMTFPGFSRSCSVSGTGHAILAGRVLGCSLLIAISLISAVSRPCVGQEPPQTAKSVDWSHQIAAIVHEKCSSCHRPGQVGPFPLLTSDDVRSRAKTVIAVIEKGYMPPWKPVGDEVRYANDRSLSAEQKRIFRQWVDAGCPEGPREEAPAPPSFADGWSLGPPDLVVTMQGQFQIPADGPDLYRSFVFPLDLPEDRWVKAVELRPKARSAIHHALFFLDSSGTARTLDGRDGQAGMAGMGFLAGPDSGSEPRGGGLLGRLTGRGEATSRPADNTNNRIDARLDGGLGGYVPGAMPSLLPGDLAMELPAGSDIVMQTHFHPSGKAETEQAELALYFADQPPARKLVPIQVPPMFGFGANLDIPAGKSDFRISDTFRVPVDVEAISVGGHAHYICRAMDLTATLPDGQKIPLLRIDDWDLDWQDRYLFAEPVVLPAGTEIRTEIIYDNSASNPENPHSPPQRIRWGRQSNDEMGSITLLVVAADESERPVLQTAVREHFTATIANRFLRGRDLGQMLIQLDENRDGKLQRSEAPPRLAGRGFALLDQNRDDALDEEELGRLGELVERMGGGNDDRER
jgi:hypothetical protein